MDFHGGSFMFTGKFIRIGAAYAMFSAMAWAQPSLTTIADVLFKADGRRFNGLAQFTWVSFESGNGSNIAQQAKTVRIIDGNLFVQLTPTTDAVPAAQYSVKYSSDGKIQFEETWADRKSTRLNSSHLGISYAVFCLKKKKNTDI